LNAQIKIIRLEQEYSRWFVNLNEVEHVSFFHRPEFVQLLQKAIDRNSPLTRQEVEEVFGDPGWGW